MPRFILLILLLLLSFPAQAQYADNERIDQLEKQMNTLERAVYRGQTPPAPSSDDSDMAPAEAASTGVRLTQMEEKLNSLQGKIEEIEHRMGQLENAAPAPVVIPATPQAAPIPDWNTPNSVDDSSAILSNPVEEAYERAFSALREKRYAEAAQGFKEFIANYPGHVLGSNAYYWMGESYYAEKDYEQASVNFLQGYQEFPKGNKAPDSLLKLAMALGNLNKKTEACATLKKADSEFPGASVELKQRLAQEKTNLKCN